MADELAIPYLEKEAIIAAIEIANEMDYSRPVSKLFNRAGHDAELVEVRVSQRRPQQVKHTTMDGEGVPIRNGTFKVRQYRPTWMKLFAELTARDSAMFRKAAEAKQMADGSPQGTMAIQRANERINELGQALAADLGTERERLCVGAILGSISATMADGNTETVSYGLHAQTAPSTKWDSAAAAIVTNLYAAIDEFKQNNPRSLPPKVAFYHPSLYVNAFVGNTEWKDFKKASPELAAGYLRLTSGARIEATEQGYFTDPLFGLTWIPVDGTYLNGSAAATNFWSYKDIVLARPEEAGFEWGMTYGHAYNPTPQIGVQIENPTRPDVQVWKVHAFDNGLPVLKQPEYVQTWRVIT